MFLYEYYVRIPLDCELLRILLAVGHYRSIRYVDCAPPTCGWYAGSLPILALKSPRIIIIIILYNIICLV